VVTGRAGLQLRWSWRDLRARWLQVAAIALIVAIGSGVHAGLSSSSGWRRTSYDESYALLGHHDLRVELGTGVVASADRLRAVLAGVDDVERVEVRLVTGTQVDASSGDDTVLVPGRLVGVELAGDGPTIDRVHATSGRGLGPDDVDRDVAVLDLHFARHHDLRVGGPLLVGGGQRLEVVGHGLQPEHFVIQSEYGSVFAEASYAVIFVPIAVARRAAGHPDGANDAVLRLRDGAAATEVRARVEAALARDLPEVTATVTTRAEDPVRRLLYDDIEGDQRFYDIFSTLILGGAAFAAFNLVTRIVEAQRREIGIGMALGLERRHLAVRPVLVGLQVALLGALAGVGVGAGVGGLISQVNQDFFPLPVWRTELQVGAFLRGVSLGLVLPFVATLWPVWRAVRTQPVDALRPAGAASLRSGLTPWAARFAGSGHSLRRMPLRNVLRAPRRSLLTALAIGTSIATMLGVIGMLDSVLATIDVGEREVLADEPDRLVVDLAGFQAADSPTVQAVQGSPLVDAAEPYLRIGGRLGEGAAAFDTLLIVAPLDSELWHPTAVEGSLAAAPGGPGIVLSRKAAEDLEAPVGSTVALRHPVREGLGYRWAVSRLRVRALHGNPLRAIAYVDTSDASLFRLDGIVNALQVRPAAGAAADEVQRGLFSVPGVGAVDRVASVTEGLRSVIDESVGVLDVVRFAVLLLALLIAYNSSSIGADERAREHATMLAFGLPVRRVLGITVVESLVVGVAGTLAGLVAGGLLLRWLVGVVVPETLPDLAVTVAVRPATILTAALLGTLAVAAAPLLTVRRFRRMDLPATLRVVE